MGGLDGGGNGICAFSYYVNQGNGSYSQAFGSTNVTGTCAQQRAQCAAFADNLALNGGISVHYDSGCDGWGV